MNLDVEGIAVITAISAGFAGLSPVLLSWLNGRQLRAAKQQDYDRQDQVEMKVAEAANLLLAANERVARNSVKIIDKLELVHETVNSKMDEILSVAKKLAFNEGVLAGRAESVKQE